jgi:hypothetical protein
MDIMGRFSILTPSLEPMFVWAVMESWGIMWRLRIASALLLANLIPGLKLEIRG